MEIKSFFGADLDAVIPYETAYRAALGDGVKVSNGQLTADCPFHRDSTQSLSVEISTGKFLCHSCGVAGNFVSFYAKTHGIDTREAYSRICREYGLVADEADHYDLKVYCKEKHFSEDLVRSWGLTDAIDGKGILIPYRNADGKIVATQYRHNPKSKTRFHWEKGSQVCLYGEDRLAEFSKVGTVILTEGVSDAQTLWACDLPGVGVPGAQSFKAEDARKLMSFDRIVIHEDNDKAGSQFVRRVKSLLHKAGFQGVVGVFRSSDCGCKDPSELYCKMGPEEAASKLSELIDKTVFSKVEAESEIDLASLSPDLVMPSEYYFTKTGVFQRGDEAPVRVSYAPLAITGIIEADGNEMLEIALFVRSVWKKIYVAKTDIFSAASLVRILSSYGCDVPQSQAGKVMHYLASFEISNPDLPITKTANTCGWIDSDHFLPYGADEWRLDKASGNGIIAQALCEKGDLDVWVQTMKPLRNNVVFRFFMASSFAAPLLEIVGVRSYFAYVWCTSGKGKTAALHAALSVWGKPEDLMATFNTTSVGLERRAAYLNGLPLAIDERQIAGNDNASQRKLETEIYNLVNGVGRIRGNRDGGLQEISEWKTVVLSTGEQPLITSSTQDGASNRTVELSAPPFDDGFNPGTLYGLTADHYGHAGAAFIRGIIKMGRAEIRAQYDDILRVTKSSVSITNGSHISDLSVAALSDYLAGMLVFGESDKDACDGALTMIKRIAESIERNSRRDVNVEALEMLNAWFASNTSHFISGNESRDPIYGFYNGLNANKTEYLELCIFCPAFKSVMIDAGYSPEKTLRFMREKGLIVAEKDKNTVKRSCKEIDFDGRVICIRKSAFGRFLTEIGSDSGQTASPSTDNDSPPAATSKQSAPSNFKELGPNDEIPF